MIKPPGIEITEGIKLVSKAGFEFATLLDAMPEEVAELYAPFYKKNPKWKHFLRHLTKHFSSVGLAIVAGYTPEERKEHLAKKRKERADAKKGNP